MTLLLLFHYYCNEVRNLELDEDLVTMIEDLIERRRERRYGDKHRQGS